jgi:hypothetical protein
LGSLFLAAGSVQAKEGGDQYPNGAENWFAGAVPPPGNYFINYAGNWSGKLKDGSGNNVVAGGAEVKLNATFDALRFVQVTNQTLFGGSWAWHVIVPVVDLSVDLAPLGGSASQTGLGDITIDPLIIAWHTPEWHTVVGLDINLPTGSYNKSGGGQSDPRKDIGANYYSVEPIFGASYLGNNGWEVSGKFMYNIKTKNTYTNYQSGDEFHMDYLVGKNINNWGFGVSGYYLKQLTDDTQNGVKVATDGNRGQVFAAGPSVKYKNQSGTLFIGQWQHEMAVENRFGGDKVWLKLIMPL